MRCCCAAVCLRLSGKNAQTGFAFEIYLENGLLPHSTVEFIHSHTLPLMPNHKTTAVPHKDSALQARRHQQAPWNARQAHRFLHHFFHVVRRPLLAPGRFCRICQCNAFCCRSLSLSFKPFEPFFTPSDTCPFWLSS